MQFSSTFYVGQGHAGWAHLGVRIHSTIAYSIDARKLRNAQHQGLSVLCSAAIQQIPTIEHVVWNC